jgi:hypothetical protein
MIGSATGSSTFATWLWGRELQIGPAYLSVAPDGKHADINRAWDRRPLLTMLSPENVEGWLGALEVLAGRVKP